MGQWHSQDSIVWDEMASAVARTYVNKIRGFGAELLPQDDFYGNSWAQERSTKLIFFYEH